MRKDPRWLPAFWTTQSEIVVPIVSEKGGHVLGMIDAESDQLNAFTDDDTDFLEHVAVLMARKLCTAKKNHAAAALSGCSASGSLPAPAGSGKS